METKPAIEQDSDAIEKDLHRALDIIRRVKLMFFNATLTKDGCGCIVDAATFNEIAADIVNVIPE